jgi:hypothetical protein
MRSAKRLLLAYAYSSSNFFFRRNKNNNSNDRWFALESIFSSLFLSLSFSFLLYVSPVVLLLLPIVIRMTFFSFFSRHRPTRIRIFVQSNHFFGRSSPRRERICVYVCMCMFLLLLTSRGCYAREKNVHAKRRELIKHFRRLLHDLLISQLKCTYTCGSNGKIGSKGFLFAIVAIHSYVQRKFSLIN